MKDYPVTLAVRFLKDHAVEFGPHPYKYTGPGQVAKEAAKALGVPEEAVYKTLVFFCGKSPVMAVVDAAHKLSEKKLAALIPCKEGISECPARDAERLTSYQVGGISPFGTRKPIPVFLDAASMAHETIYINGGARGFLVSLAPSELVRTLGATVGDIRTAAS